MVHLDFWVLARWCHCVVVNIKIDHYLRWTPRLCHLWKGKAIWTVWFSSLSRFHASRRYCLHLHLFCSFITFLITFNTISSAAKYRWWPSNYLYSNTSRTTDFSLRLCGFFRQVFHKLSYKAKFDYGHLPISVFHIWLESGMIVWALKVCRSAAE